MKTKDLTPEDAAAADTSRATFSFVENSKYRPASEDIFSRMFPISEEGVPGYVEAKPTPASMRPRTIASFPRRSCFPPSLSRFTICHDLLCVRILELCYNWFA